MTRVALPDRTARGSGARSLGARGLWAAVLVAEVAGIGGIAGSAPDPGGPLERAVTVASTSAPADVAGVEGFRSVRTYVPVAVPTRLRIPAQRIDTTLQRLGLEADGSIAAPTRWELAGWYAGGARPGQPGVAVIAGHVDSATGPAVFYRLPRLRPGAVVLVDRADGSTARFRVTGQRQVPKDHFPASALYYPTLRATLLLLTCGGTFDAATGHYRDNVVVSAEQV
jgi:Sortase domain